MENELAFLDVWKPPPYLWEEPDHAAAQALRKVMLRKYNDNLFLAWRRVLDKDSSMKVNYTEFNASMKELSRAGLKEASPSSLTALYVAFDSDRSGWFTLKNWDEESHDLLVQFLAFVKKGLPADKKIIDFFRGLEDHADHTVNLSAFRKATKGSGLQDRDAIFEGLLVQGRSLLEIWPSWICGTPKKMTKRTKRG